MEASKDETIISVAEDKSLNGMIILQLQIELAQVMFKIPYLHEAILDPMVYIL